MSREYGRTAERPPAAVHRKQADGIAAGPVARAEQRINSRELVLACEANRRF